MESHLIAGEVRRTALPGPAALVVSASSVSGSQTRFRSARDAARTECPARRQSTGRMNGVGKDCAFEISVATSEWCECALSHLPLPCLTRQTDSGSD